MIKEYRRGDYIRVLSLFDGMSCGQIALERVGIKIHTYYASEIDKYSIKITQKNYPNTIQLGDVRDLTTERLKKLGQIDLLIGGSPCRNLSKSIQGHTKNHKNMKRGLNGQSALFFEYVRILKEIKPKYFLFENVASMQKEDKLIISDTLEVEPILVNSSLVSAQDRERYYWTNIDVTTLPTDRNMLLDDIIQPSTDVDEQYWYNISYEYYGDKKRLAARLNLKGFDEKKRVYNLNYKAPTLISCRGGNLQRKIWQDGRPRKLTPLEYERLQTVPEGYTKGVADSHRYNMLGDGWTVDVIAHILSGIKNT